MDGEEAVGAVVKCFVEGDYQMCRFMAPASRKPEEKGPANHEVPPSQDGEYTR